MFEFTIYCDGACSGNPGPGAWSYVVFNSKKSLVFSGSGFEEQATNNRMELMAVIKALEGFDGVNLVLDSKYVLDGITSWIHNWKRNGWRSTTGTVRNVDLWQDLDRLVSDRKIEWSWQKGHASSLHDFADELARESVLR